MQTVLESSYTQYEIKKSHFIAHIVPFDAFERINNTLRQEHPKANHVVWAYRTLNSFGQIVENSSDDGEPKGTSGPPVLNVMRGAELIECAILIVRYFGGIKLGTGGLVRAYSSAANEAITQAPLVIFERKELCVFKTDYPLVQRMEHYFSKEKISVEARRFEADGVVWDVPMTTKERESFEVFASVYERDGFTRL